MRTVSRVKSAYMATWTIRWFLAGAPLRLHRWQASGSNSETMCTQTSDMVTLLTKSCMGLHSWLFSLFVVLLVIAWQIIDHLFWNQTIRVWRWNKSFSSFQFRDVFYFVNTTFWNFGLLMPWYEAIVWLKIMCIPTNPFWSFQIHGRVQALECVMGNQGKMESSRNSKACKEVWNDEMYSWHAILGFLLSKTEDMRSKVRQNKFGENGYCRNSFINKSFCHTFLVIPQGTKLQRMHRDKKAIFTRTDNKSSSSQLWTWTYLLGLWRRKSIK